MADASALARPDAFRLAMWAGNFLVQTPAARRAIVKVSRSVGFARNLRATERAEAVRLALGEPVDGGSMPIAVGFLADARDCAGHSDIISISRGNSASAIPLRPAFHNVERK